MYSKMRLVLILVAICGAAAFEIHPLSAEFDRKLAETASLILTPQAKILALASGKNVNLLNVPDVYQFYNYSSGHAAMEGIFSYYQFPTSAVKYRQDMFINPSDFDNHNFASPQNLVKAALRKLGNETDPQRQNVFDLDIKESLSTEALFRFIDQKVPPILLFSGKTNSPSGYYVIAIGYDDTRVYFQDPYRLGSIGYLSRIELDSVWKNYIISEDRSTNHLAIIISYKDGRSVEKVPLIRPCP